MKKVPLNLSQKNLNFEAKTCLHKVDYFGRNCWAMFSKLKQKSVPIVTTRNEVCEGYVFTPVCHTVHGGSCMAEGHAWWWGGGQLCVAEGMHGRERGHAWVGGMHGREVCMARMPPPGRYYEINGQ